MRLIGLVLLMLLAVESGPVCAHKGTALNFFTWPDYVDPSLVREFEERYRVDVVEHYFTSDQDRTALLESGDVRYDVILVAGSYLRSYAQRGWIAELNAELIPTWAGVDANWRNAFVGSALYGLPYMWGTTGIAYRSDLLPKPPTTWMALLRPDHELQGYVQMTRDTHELLQVALKALGYSLNSDHDQEIEEAKQLLIEQRPYVTEYQYSANIHESLLLDGRARAAFSYSGDALMLQEINSEIRFVVPTEGSNLWGDYLAVSARTEKVMLAHLFLNFLNQPEHAARNAAYLHSATPNLEARALLPASILNNTVIYPTDSMLKNSEFSRWSHRDAITVLKGFWQQLFEH